MPNPPAGRRAARNHRNLADPIHRHALRAFVSPLGPQGAVKTSPSNSATTNNTAALTGPRDSRDPRDTRDPRDIRDPRDPRNRDFRNPCNRDPRRQEDSKGKGREYPRH
jgi:hypothetical protein